MTRTTAREIAMHLIYEMEYHDELPEELFQKVFEEDYYPRLAEETDLYQEKPNAKQLAYIEDCVRGVYVKKQRSTRSSRPTPWAGRSAGSPRCLWLCCGWPFTRSFM